MDNQLIFEGLKMMVVGMGMVFSFLVIMVFCMGGMSKILAPFSHLLAAPAPAAKRKPAPAVDPAAVAAAVAAMHANKK